MEFGIFLYIMVDLSLYNCEGPFYVIENFHSAELWRSFVWNWGFPLFGIVDFSCIYLKFPLVYNGGFLLYIIVYFPCKQFGLSLYVIIHFHCILLLISIICKCGFYFYFIAVFTHKQMGFCQICHCGHSLYIFLEWISLLRHSGFCLYIIVDFSSVFSPHVIVLNVFIFSPLHKITCYKIRIVSPICPLFNLTWHYKSTCQFTNIKTFVR